MLLLILSIMSGITFCAEDSHIKIAHFHPRYIKSAYDLIVKNQEQMIPLYQSLKSGEITQEKYEQEALEEVSAFLNDDVQPKRVLLHGQRVIGFAGFCKYKERSIESMLKYYQSQQVPVTENQLVEMYPAMKRKETDCHAYAFITGFVIEESYRGSGLGKQLFADLIRTIAQSSNFISYACLQVRADNLPARHIYESVGFKLNEKQHTNERWVRYKKIFSEKNS
jgi:ribosomal protein S18 acetylase RimI-like enzyme